MNVRRSHGPALDPRVAVPLLPLLLLMAAMLLCAPGCYSRVVKQSGIGRGAEKVYEPNLRLPEDDDPWNFGTSSGGQATRNWKAAGQKSKPKPVAD